MRDGHGEWYTGKRSETCVDIFGTHRRHVSTAFPFGARRVGTFSGNAAEKNPALSSTKRTPSDFFEVPEEF